MRKGVFFLIFGFFVQLAFAEMQNSVMLGSLGAPKVMQYNGTYYGYLNDSVYTSSDLVNWTKKTNILSPTAIGKTPGYWFDGKVYYRNSYFYFLYGYATNNDYGLQNFALARGTSPLGPFTDVYPHYFNWDYLVGDASFFFDKSGTDPNGNTYIYFTSRNPLPTGYRFYVAQINNDLSIPGQTLNPAPTMVLENTLSWEYVDPIYKVIESVKVFKRENTYYLLYNANGFGSPDYCVSYATASSPFGPFSKIGYPILQKDVPHGIIAPGYTDFVYSNDGSEFYLVYQNAVYDETLYYATYMARNARIDKLAFDRTSTPPRLYLENGATWGVVKSPSSISGCGSDSFTESNLDRGI